MTGERVLLMQLSERTSAKGTVYLAGLLGRARVVGFKATNPDKFGNPQWDVFVAPPRDAGDQAPRQEHQEPRQPLPERGQATHDRARRVPRETRAGFVEAWSQERESTPFFDDTEAAVADLTGDRDR